MKYAVVSIYKTHSMDHGDPELLGPFKTDEERDAELKKRYEDDCEEDIITISLLETNNDKIFMTGGFIAEPDESWYGDEEDSEGNLFGYDDSE